ncbi:ATP-dependent nuclease [Bacillus mycoides]|uniref:ATP-dependent nuclease n=1 Tax=Bacillus mycoides TaxID=1405 RepID=UPI003CFBC731
MAIEWVRIKNFRSIQDSGEIYLQSGLSVLAGKNESGKTNILRALNCFFNEDFSPDDYPENRESPDEIPTVEVGFRFGQKNLDLDSTQQSSKNFIDYKVKKSANGKLEDNSFDVLEFLGQFQSLELMQLFRNLVRNSILEIQPYIEEIPSLPEDIAIAFHSTEAKYIFENLFSILHKDRDNMVFVKETLSLTKKLGRFTNRVKTSISKKYKLDKKPTELEDAIQEALLLLKQLEIFVFHVTNFYEIRFKEPLNSAVPSHCIFFDSFEDVLPDSIHIPTSNTKIISNLYTALGIKEAQTLLGWSRQQKIKELKKLSTNITGEFMGSYSQNTVEIIVDIDGETLYPFIQDPIIEAPIKPSQRSKGFQWFLSFFLYLNAQNKKNTLILIDEPGLYLHAKAQNDILKMLRRLSKSRQIIITTHSPYLIDTNNLANIRLVFKDKQNNTVVENKIHNISHDIDVVSRNESLTPITTAIGLDISKSLGGFGRRNIIVEGISEYYYLNAMLEYYNLKEKYGELHIIPCTGASNVPNIASILMGWGLAYKCLLDNDEAGKEAKKKLNKLTVKETDIIFVTDEDKTAIEDLFSKNDFHKYVINGASSDNLKVLEKVEKNSIIMGCLTGEIKNKNINKEIENNQTKGAYAAIFAERLQNNPSNFNFEDVTRENFKKIFEKLYSTNIILEEYVKI